MLMQRHTGFDYKTCSVMVAIEQQSPEIMHSVLCHGEDAAAREGPSHPVVMEEVGAGDQGLMFGYATDETAEMMPLTLVLAHRITARLAELRRGGVGAEGCAFLRPDCKSQVTVEYRMEGGAAVPVRVHTIVLSTQHAPDAGDEMMREVLLERVIKAVIPHAYLDDRTIYHIQPSGRFVIGGPQSDAGLTGRKIIVDTYGGWGAHGGGAFSGKDWTKVDRSGAYAARWIAKSLVAAKLARRCLIQISYSIGLTLPLSIHVDTYGSGRVSDADLIRIIAGNFDLRPGAIARQLGLDQPIFEETACYGHFGRSHFSWEQAKDLVLPM